MSQSRKVIPFKRPSAPATEPYQVVDVRLLLMLQSRIKDLEEVFSAVLSTTELCTKPQTGGR